MAPGHRHLATKTSLPSLRGRGHRRQLQATHQKRQEGVTVMPTIPRYLPPIANILKSPYSYAYRTLLETSPLNLPPKL